MDDAQLMLLVKDGKLSHLGQLFERYQLRLFNYFLKVTGRVALSEDLTQNVFERILKHRHTYRADFPFQAWIFRIAHNVRIDHYRKQKLKYDDNIDPGRLELVDDGIEENARHAQIQVDMQRALDRMNEEYKEVLVLTRFEQMKYAQVAEVLGISEGAVKVKVHRAIKQLSGIYRQIAAS